MLGRLFGNAASSMSSASYPRDSIVDEEYTRGLLYPDHAFPQDAHTHVPHIGQGRVGDFDDWSGLELDAARDLRIIIAQDALGDSDEPCVLFDTHPLQQSESPSDFAQRVGSLQSPIHRRGGSTTSNFKSPTSPLFFKPQQKMSSNGPNLPFPTRNRSSTFSGASDEHDPRHIRSSDSKEETRNILSCAFGSSAGASSGMKMHLLSLGSSAKEPLITPSSPDLGANTSAGYFRKREPIARAHTSTLSGVRPPLHERSQSSSASKPKFTDAVLISRLFSVNLPDPTDLQMPHSSQTAQKGTESSNNGGHVVHDRPTKGKKPRAKKTPVFAVILVVQLPINSSTFSRPPSRGGVHTLPAQSSVSSFRNSFNSHSSSFQLVDRGDPRVNSLVEHWDVLDRTLTLLENVAAPKIHGHLKEVDDFSAALVSKPSKPKEKTMQRTNQINIYLAPLVLGNDRSLKDNAMQAVQRIRRALRIPRVTIGQERWGLWNDELIRIARCNGGTEQNLFILTLLTAFLGAHTAEWMTLLAPSWYRRRRSNIRKTTELDVITTRTVIVSNDRSMARRLVFLLSSFLGSDVHSEKSSSLHAGPDSYVSLRNVIIRSPSVEQSSNLRARSPERHDGRNLDNMDRPQGGLLIHHGLQRKPSDIRSIRSIAIPANDLSARKSSTVTTSTATPNSTTPVPQFSSSSGPEGGYISDEASASACLTKIWQNANRDSESTTTSTKWGSLLSGFWSKESSASASQSTAPSTSSSMRVRKPTLLENMVNELGSDDNSGQLGAASQLTQSVESSPSKALPHNLQVNTGEGVIDVDIGIPGFLSSSNDSGLISPTLHSIRHVSSVASFDSLVSQKRHGSSKRRASPHSRVVGFLPKFHPDYTLQAVRVSKSELPDMLEKVKTAMLSEPHSQDLTTTGWVDVSTTLIANVQTQSVKRLRLKRRVFRIDDHTGETSRPSIPIEEHSNAPIPNKSSSTTFGEFVCEEAFSYESVTGIDPTFTGAIEQILARDVTHGSRSVSPLPPNSSRQSYTEMNGINRGRTEPHMGHSSFSPDGFWRGLSDSLVVGALEEVVKNVNHDLREERREHNSETSGRKQASAQVGKLQENALREGVRSWLLNAEQTAIW